MQADVSTSSPGFGAPRMQAAMDWVPAEFLPGFEQQETGPSPSLMMVQSHLPRHAPDCTCLSTQAVSGSRASLAAREKKWSPSEPRCPGATTEVPTGMSGVFAVATYDERDYLEAIRQNGIKDHFLVVLAHELRTPLQAIMAWTEVLASGASDLDELAQGLAVIRESANYQSRLIEDLLDMSRMVSGSIRLELQPVDLAAVIQLAVDTLKPQACSRGVLVHTSLASSLATAEADPVRLHQIFGNLLTNAIKFTPPGGHIHLHLEGTPSHFAFRIADNGEGIDPAFLPYVFDRFLRGDTSTTRRHDGLGLGLSIVKHLVELHGGSIQAASEGLGKGATFTVTLPIITPPDRPAVSAKAPFQLIQPLEMVLAANRHAVAESKWAVA
ncbi:HAMP domain-containing sensor histidine kinase [Verrucomicrobium sp. BvORR106]|uniref:sensor histidine kinase n=1 Tax=Verrucomicrobium sp. BvORR106 TaxID=1403819 RepID=UPI002240EC85|nr:HAMP domain-containing sensor histidine kinase [Verrucomicrobium sp. BvORR106]